MRFRDLFSPCLLSHADAPLIVMRQGRACWECRSCQADLGAVLGVKPKRVIKLKKRKSADVLYVQDRKRA